MQHGVDPVFIEGRQNGGGVAEIALDECEAIGVLLGEEVHRGDVPAVEVIQTNDMVAVGEQSLASV